MPACWKGGAECWCRVHGRPIPTLMKTEDPMSNTLNPGPAKGSQEYRFVVSRSTGAEYETDGLREEFVYRDLGLADATHGDFHAHIIKAKHLHGGHNGLHRHLVNLQFAMVLKGWVSFYYADHGEFRYEQGDTVTIPGNTLHELREYSEDLELLELTSPAVYRTVRQDGSEMPTPGQKARIQERTTAAVK
jgi:quercetin dioxygenase-like cupin family protein